jgi:aminoglycoside phosphotransferase (APT) family kinase protein
MQQRGASREPDPRDAVLDEAVVLSLARRHLDGVSAVTAIDEIGGEARAYVIDGIYILKTQRPHRVRTRTSLEKAAFHQMALAREVPEVSVPRVLGYGREENIEYVLETRIPGVAVQEVALGGDARRSVLFELGRTLRRIHGVELAPFEASGMFPGDSNADEVKVRIVEGLRSAAEAVVTQKEPWPFEIDPVTLTERALAESADLDLKRSALHSNPGPEHVYVDPTSLRFQGLIDFGDAYISHAVFDMRRWSSPGDRAALIDGYGAESQPDDAFLRTWRTVILGGLMATIAGTGPGVARPERRQAALNDLSGLITEI